MQTLECSENPYRLGENSMILVGSIWFTLMLSFNLGVTIWALFGFIKDLDSFLMKGLDFGTAKPGKFRVMYTIKILLVLIAIAAIVASGLSIQYFSLSL